MDSEPHVSLTLGYFKYKNQQQPDSNASASWEGLKEIWKTETLRTDGKNEGFTNYCQDSISSLG